LEGNIEEVVVVEESFSLNFETIFSLQHFTYLSLTSGVAEPVLKTSF